MSVPNRDIVTVTVAQPETTDGDADAVEPAVS
ncbi:hypothetical protein FHT80_001362 [Rhizobium sp. BK226]|jgi:hypothetical protein|nr:hypothetical protein [Rhizobium sp. BK112]MBB3367402.1 hypothetical protein [Rhizobium sp. BK077]MBB4112046.1 hypothetical protein [Rhizobium sp. BK226]MBB4178582.1 hypothetical protein [Rhizobium sp. BK109]MBB4251762.1 hypothetical protein [Rhizobium sp. BK008]